jgi:hypothetical protein
MPARAVTQAIAVTQATTVTQGRAVTSETSKIFTYVRQWIEKY